MYTKLIQEAIHELGQDANYDTIAQYALAVNPTLREDERAMDQFLLELASICLL